MLRLGILGMSEGNGHPFSWSAICNGYNPEAMEDCGFPVIPQYLAEQQWPAARIPDVEVTHVWTQEEALSRKISECALIENVVDKPEHMIGNVDAILLARDDAENHLKFAQAFLEAGLPIYIDKPVALSTDSLNQLYRNERFSGQIFSCSALRYAHELHLSAEQMATLGKIHLLRACTPNDWDRYAIHIIDPVLALIGHEPKIERMAGTRLNNGGISACFAQQGGPFLHLTAFGRSTQGPIEIAIHAERGSLRVEFRGAFSAFRRALLEFCERVRSDDPESTYPFNERAVSIIEMGRQP